MKSLLAIATVVVATVGFAVAAWADVPAGTYSSTVNAANAPSGTHFGTGSTAPTCTVGSDLSVTCGDGSGSTSSYTLQGVGHTNATLDLVATYSAVIYCYNGGGQLVAEKTNSQTTETGPIPVKATRNGSMTVPSISASPPTSSLDVCPNRNWTPVQQSLTLDSYDYTLTFQGFSSPFIENP
jgi:hypothetical protein